MLAAYSPIEDWNSKQQSCECWNLHCEQNTGEATEDLLHKFCDGQQYCCILITFIDSSGNIT